MNDKKIINGGYYIKARSIKDSDIMRCPPYIREVWDWLLMNVNHADGKSSGKIIKRGQLHTSFDEIIAGLVWYIGYRKMGYTKDHMKNAMRTLKKLSMITTSKSTTGLLITICNYEFFADPKNYDNTSDNTNDNTNENPTITPMQHHLINKKKKNDKKKEEIKDTKADLPFWLPLMEWSSFLQARVSIKKPASPHAQSLLLKDLEKLRQRGYDPKEVLEQSIKNNWLGLFEVKEAKSNDRNNGNSTDKQRNNPHGDFAAAAFEFAFEQ